MEFKFEIVVNHNLQPGNIYLIPSFVKCPECGHEIPVKEIIEEMELERYFTDGMITDNGGCKKKISIANFLKKFGVIKNVG